MATTPHHHWYQDLSPYARQYIRWLGIAFLTGLALSSFAFAWYYAVSAYVAASTRTSPRQISVSGEGIIPVKPDTASFTAGVVSQAKKVSEARRENTARSNAVIDFLKSQGVADKDVKTASYGITPQYQYFTQRPCTGESCPPQRPPEIASYEVRHTIEVKIRDLARADILLDGVVRAGANEVGALAFRVDDPDAAKTDARAKAIADAEAKARKIARDLGVRLARVNGFYEQDAGFPPPLFAGGDAEFALKTAEAAPRVEPGEQEIKSSVTITYEFR